MNMKMRSFFNTLASVVCTSFLLLFLSATQANAQATSRITVTKDFCASIGQQNTCNGVPALFPSSVTFLVELGTYDTGTGIFTVSGTSANVVVAIAANANGTTTTGDIFTSGTWLRVCEITPSGWQSIPRPENSSGGAQQFAQGRCLIAELGPGNNSLKFINGPGGTTAADALISGRVLDANGLGISRVQLTLVDGETGETRTALTSPFGYYMFGEVEVGRLYILNVSHRRYRFAEPQKAITLGENATDVDFIALQSK
jgi:hypothetical protein